MPWGDIAAFLVVVAGGLLSSWLVDRILPFHHKTRETADLKSLRQKYRNWQMGVMAVWFVVLYPIAAVLTWRVMTRFAAVRYAKLGRSEFSFFPGGVEWGLPAAFLAAAISIVLLWLGVRLYLGKRYSEYRRYETLEWGIGKWTPWLALIGIAAGSLLGALALLDCYAVFAKDRIRVNELFAAGERTYQYKHVRSIRTAPKWIAPVGNEVARREYVFCFHDGTSWSTNWAPGAITQSDRQKLAELVAAFAEIEIAESSVLTRGDQSCR